MARVVVVGSINADLVLRPSRLPAPGETVVAASSEWLPGGKGANQAHAAAMVGGHVTFLGAVGDDALAEIAIGDLAAIGVDVSHVATLDEPTGVAVVTVDDHGENCIVVAAGANRAAGFPVEAIAGLTPELVLVSTEVAPATVLAALVAADEVGATTVLAAGPADEVTADQLALADHVVCNQGEVEVLGALLAAVPRRQVVVVTAGADGAVVRQSSGRSVLEAPPVDVVDTVGAGDCFAAAYSVAVAEGVEPVLAARRAVIAASLAVGVAGARGAPSRRSLDAAAGR